MKNLEQSSIVSNPAIDVDTTDTTVIWSPTDDIFDWGAFAASMPAVSFLPAPEFDDNGNIVTTPGTVTTAPNDPESGWNSDDMVFITNDQGETADFHVAYDANGVAHYTIPDGTDAIYAAYLQESFADWL